MSGSAPAERAIELDVSRVGDKIEVTLTGNSPSDQRVEYEIELSGSSATRHKGSTILRAHDVAVLSTMRMNATPAWCVTARITEQDGRTYQYSEGSCS